MIPSFKPIHATNISHRPVVERDNLQGRKRRETGMKNKKGNQQHTPKKSNELFESYAHQTRWQTRHLLIFPQPIVSIMNRLYSSMVRTIESANFCRPPHNRQVGGWIEWEKTSAL